MDNFRLTKDEVAYLAKEYTTPLLVVSLAHVSQNYQFLKEKLPRVKIFYAVKANPADCIVKALGEMGSCFDAASDGEMLQLERLGITPERIVYANPFKTPKGLKVAKEMGVNKFTFDSESEIDKMAEAVPGGTVLLRIKVDNPRALVDLNKKFGTAPDDAIALLKKAKEKGLDVGGLCFHVGSQSPTAQAHIEALAVCRQLFDQAKEEGIVLRILDIGGGLPIPSLEMAVDLAQITTEINDALESLFPDTEIWAEPGRYICGTTVNLISSVIGTQKRNNQQWYFLDDGLYGSFSGILFDHWDYELVAFKSGEKEAVTFAGPSCDSLDVLFKDKMCVPLTIGDVLLVPNCGAYTSASATEFNGFTKTPIFVWEQLKENVKYPLR